MKKGEKQYYEREREMKVVCCTERKKNWEQEEREKMKRKCWMQEPKREDRLERENYLSFTSITLVKIPITNSLMNNFNETWNGIFLQVLHNLFLSLGQNEMYHTSLCGLLC